MLSRSSSMLSILNPTPRKLPGPDKLHLLVATEANDGRPAIEYLLPEGNVEQLTYQQLHQKADDLALVLRSKLNATSSNQHRRQIVPIFIQQSPQLYISELAILKAGAAFCPLSLDVPEQRLRFILDDVQATVLLTTSQLRERLPVLDSVSIVTVDDAASDHKYEEVPMHIDPSQAAYIMYTSGSTGQPKGVILSHSAVTQALLAHDRHIPEFSRFLQFANSTFDVSVFEIFFPLFRGRTLVCGDRRKLLNDLPGFINTMNIDAAELTPSVASSLLRGREQVPSLRLLLTIGEMLKRDVIEDYGGSSKEQSILYGMYGPTEATIHCTLQPRFTSDASTGNIGVPLDTVSAFIIKAASEDENSASEEVDILPIGEEGELAVGGYQLADGYLNRPEQTKSVFVTHPTFGNLYRTGDRANLTAAGLLQCSGRISSGQVKLRGQRIELGEIEYAAARTPGCQTAVAEIVSGSLVVFCVFRFGTANETDVREVCRKWLPAFMVPAVVCVLDELPYLDSGKVDRKALHALYASRKAHLSGKAEDEDDQLQSITEVLSKVLQVSVDSETPLLAAGMDSLSSIRISAELKRAGFRQVDATVILESRTAHDINTELQRIESTNKEQLHIHSSVRERFANLGPEISKHPIFQHQKNEIEHIFPSTIVQSSMLLETARNRQAYCNWIEFELDGDFKSYQVLKAIQQLAEIHILLRAGFIAVEGWQTTHAVVIWRDLQPSQIRLVREFCFDYQIASEEDLLRPCKFQVKTCDDRTRILLQIHHAQYDQWSLDVLRTDLHAILQGQKPASRPSFETVSQLHFERYETARSDEHLEYWYNHLRGFTPTPLSLISGRKLGQALRRTDWYDLGCNPDLMRSKAKELRCSVPSIFQSAMAHLLGTYVGSTDVTLGIVFSGRHIPVDGIEGVFGPCLSTLPMRLNYSTTRTCAELIRLVHSRNREMQKHSLTPLADVKGLFRDFDNATLFDTLFVWQDTSLKCQSQELSVREINAADHHEYNLVLEFEPTNDDIRAKATFQQALIPPEQVDQIVTQIKHYVKHIITNPQGLVENMKDSLPVSALSISNPEPTNCSPGRDLIRAIENHAEDSPSAPAIVFASSIQSFKANSLTLTYRELNEESNRLARFIHSSNSAPANVVGIYMEKSMDLYIAILAAIKAGFGYLPIIPDTPISRVRSVLQQAGISFCLCDNNTSRNLGDAHGLNSVDIAQLDLSGLSTHDLNTHFADDRVAYTVFTSGSTGEPKGVPVTMQNLLGNIQALSELYPATAGDRLLQACSHAFDVSVFEIFFTLYNGMCLCSATKDVLFQDFELSIRAFNITHLSLTPTVAALVDPAEVPSVRFLVTAGEAVTQSVHSHWAGNGLHQGYGPSETTNICSVKMNVSPDDVISNIGPPLCNTSAFVLSTDSSFEILPCGAIGELAFGGEQVFPGYIGRDDLNEGKIIQHESYGRIYRSGDLGRILHDGTMLICGRLDDQVKLRGNRVELGEINAILLQDHCVRNCATIIIGEEASTQKIASFVVLESCSYSTTEHGGPDTFSKDAIHRLFDTLEAALPSYMVPTMISVVAELPRTSQGKLDRRSLGQLMLNKDSAIERMGKAQHEDANSGPEWSSEEVKIAESLTHVLSIDTRDISRHGSLFSFGLNSLNAIAFAKKLSRALGVDVSVSMVLRNPSIAKLARILTHEPLRSTVNGHAEPLDILPPHVSDHVRQLSLFPEESIESVLPCTPLQEAMLSASASSANSAYWNSLSLRVHGDIAKLRRCWTHMVQRHSILRTRFVATNDRAHPFVQIVLTDTALAWHDEKLRSATNGDLATSLQIGDKVSLTTLRPFWIDNYGGRDERRLVLHMHHAIYDGNSMSQLLKEVESEYEGVSLAEPPSFDQFLQEAAKHCCEDAMAFWSSEIRDFHPHPFPQLSIKAESEERHLQTILPITPEELDSWCRQHSVSQLATFQAALVKTLAASQNVKDICFGNVLSGRTVPVDGVERLVAPCFNTVPVRINLSGCETNVDTASRLHNKNADTLRYQLTPLRRIQALSRSPSMHLFDCLIILQPPQKALNPGVWTIEQESGAMEMPLVFELTPESGNFNLVVHYSERYGSASRAQVLCDAFSAALFSCLKYPFGSIENFNACIDSEIFGLLGSREHQLDLANGEIRTASDRGRDQDQERKISEAFAQLAAIPVQAVKSNTSMFQIGLDSLNAPQIAARLRSIGFEVDAGDVLECLTPAEIALRSQSKPPTSHRDDINLDLYDRNYRGTVLQQLHISTNAVESVWPCTPAQCGMLSQSLQSDGDLYINHMTYYIPSELSLDALRAAWVALTSKHQVLRMGFHEVDNRENPFAMSILKQGSASIPMFERDGKMSINLAEAKAKETIMQSLGTHAWCVQTLVQNHKRVMVISLHHALYDANSLQEMLEDLVKAISSRNLGPTNNIKSFLSATLSASKDVSGEAAEFWSKELDGSVVAKFPDLTPSVVKNGKLQYEERSLTVPWEAFGTFCRQENATIQALGQTIWAMLLASYVGDENVVFGTIFSGTPYHTDDGAVFPSITTMPVRCNTASTPLGILQEMVRFNASAHRHRFTPLAEVQRLAGYDNRSLFDTVFAYQKSQNEITDFDWPLVAETAAVEYTASLELQSGREGDVILRLTFRSDRIPFAQACLMLAQYEHLLKQLVFGDQSQPESLYSVLSAKEPEFPTPIRLLHEFVEQSAVKHPKKIALTFVKDLEYAASSMESWTYEQLNARANQVANMLHEASVQPGSIVAVSMVKCPEASFAFIGILKAGCSFLAIDPDLPKARLDFILQDSGAKLLFLNEGDWQNVSQSEVEYIELTAAKLDALSRVPIDTPAIRPDSTCYCLYTSGTTGTPKGCEISHENAVQAMMSFQRLFAGHWSEESRWLQFASYWFDVSVLEQFWSWSVGIAVIGAPRDVVLEDLPGFISRYCITHIDLTPSLARLLRPEDVPSLWKGVFITGGEALKQEIIDAWGFLQAICNGYGPTEATIGVTMNPFIGLDAKPSNIGPQFDNVGAFILKPNSDEPVLRGAVGELCVSGKLVGKGYLNRPELTASQFPTLAKFDERVYRTGDLVRVLSDGSFSFIGRQDSQVKLRGQRLEIAEIDNVIQSCADRVAHAISLVTKAGTGGKETLVSFLTKNPRKHINELKLDREEDSLRLIGIARQACLERLPGYMVPTHILPINFLPLTVNNKVDIKRLTELFSSCSPRDLQSLSESGNENGVMTASEQEISSVLCELLCIDTTEVTPQSNLFSLGLSSISAIPFSSFLKRQGFKKASVVTVMRNPTIKQLAVAIKGSSNGSLADDDSVEQAKLSISAFSKRYHGVAARAVNVAMEEIEAVVPCTPLQQGLILDSLRLEDHSYFNEFSYALNDTDIGRLRNAIQVLVDQVQILRTRFINTPNGAAQVVLKGSKVSIFEMHKMKAIGLAPCLRDLKLKWIEKNAEQVSEPFEVHIVHAEDRKLLVFHIHHALYDGISYDLLIDQLAKIYHGNSIDDRGPEFISALPYGPLRPLRSAKSFWERRVNDCQNVRLPVSHSITAASDHSATLTIADTALLESTRKKLGVSHQSLMQSCFEIALRKNLPAIQMYGIVVSGRSIELAGADRILGPIFNTLPQPLRLNAEMSLKEFIRSCHDAMVATLPYQHTPLRDIRKWTGRQPADSMFDVLFVFHHTRSAAKNLDSLMTPIEQETQAHYLLACEVELDDDGKIVIRILAQSKFFDQDMVQSLLDCMSEVLGSTTHHPDANLAERFGIETRTPNPAKEDHTPHETPVNGSQYFEWTATAEAIRAEIAALTGVDLAEIEEHTTIFALGLDSIDAVKLTSRLRKQGLSIPVSKMLQAQTIPRMLQAARTDEHRPANDHAWSKLDQMQKQLRNIVPALQLPDGRAVETILPATPGQEALVADMYQSEFREYFNHDVLRLRPDIDVDQLKRTWKMVIDQTPVLRTMFVEISDPDVEVVFAQVVLTSEPLLFDEREVENRDNLEAIFDSIRTEVLNSMRTRPPLRLTFVNLGDVRYLILSLTHAQYDGHSLALLHDDVNRAYHNRFTPRPSYNDAVEAALVAVNNEAQQFWADTLSGAIPRPFPRIGSNETRDRTCRAERRTTVDASSARSFCKTYGTSMQALAHTCWALTLAHYTRSIEAMFGIVLACRDSKEAEEVMFPTMNTVVMRASLHGSRAEMVQHIQSLGTDMLPYQRTPLRTIQAAVAKARRQIGEHVPNGLFDALFIYQHRPGEQEDFGEPLYDSVGGASDIEYPVAVEMEAVDGDVLVIRAACRSTVLDQAGTEQLLETVEEVFGGILNSPDDPTVDFDGKKVSVCGMDAFYLEDLNDEDNIETEQGGTDDDAPMVTSPTMVSIIEALAQVSKVSHSEITASTTIESIGIDSISAIKVAAVLRKQDIHISVSEILRAKSAALMAGAVQTTSSVPTQSASDTISRAIQPYIDQDVLGKAGIDQNEVETVLPATPGQIYMLSMWQKTAGQIFYPTFVYQLDTDAELQKIQQAWTDLAAHRPILRTTFCATRDLNMPLLQVVLREPEVAFGDCPGLTTQTPQPMVSLKANKNPLGYELRLSIHHALYDAVSLPLLIHDLESPLTGRPLPNHRLNFEDYLALSVSHRSKQLRKHFWSDYLDNTRPLTLTPPKSDGQQRKIEIFKPALFHDINHIEQIARKENLSLQSILFAAYAKVYTSLASASDSGEEDVVLGIYLSNRSHISSLETLAAPTVNLVPLVVRSTQQSSLLELAKRVQEDLQRIGSAENSTVGLWEIEQWTDVRVDTFVNFLKLPGGNDEVPEAGGAKIKAIDDQRLEERSRVVEAGDGVGFEVPKELEGMIGVDAYLHSLDIEMAVTDGKLDVGLFCPENMVSLEQAEEAVAELKALLEKFVGKAKV